MNYFIYFNLFVITESHIWNTQLVLASVHLLRWWFTVGPQRVSQQFDGPRAPHVSSTCRSISLQFIPGCPELWSKSHGEITKDLRNPLNLEIIEIHQNHKITKVTKINEIARNRKKLQKSQIEVNLESKEISL